VVSIFDLPELREFRTRRTSPRDLGLSQRGAIRNGMAAKNMNLDNFFAKAYSF
jgi:hypothetical protein